MKTTILNLFILLITITSHTQTKNSNIASSETFISNEDYTKTLLEKNFNSVADLNNTNSDQNLTWNINNNNECTSCQNNYAVIKQNNNIDQKTIKNTLKYHFRPSTNKITIQYNTVIINENEANFLSTTIGEKNTKKEQIIQNHNNNKNQQIKKTINVVPGRIYYIEITANYNTKTTPTTFMLDTLKITESIRTGTMVLTDSASITYLE